MPKSWILRLLSRTSSRHGCLQRTKAGCSSRSCAAARPWPRPLERASPPPDVPRRPKHRGTPAPLTRVPRRSRPRTRRKSTYVLVHGAWHGGWCWKKVVPALRAAGHEVYAPTLTGLGERAHLANPAIDPATHVADGVNLLEA